MNWIDAKNMKLEGADGSLFMHCLLVVTLNETLFVYVNNN